MVNWNGFPAAALLNIGQPITGRGTTSVAFDVTQWQQNWTRFSICLFLKFFRKFAIGLSTMNHPIIALQHQWFWPPFRRWQQWLPSCHFARRILWTAKRVHILQERFADIEATKALSVHHWGAFVQGLLSLNLKNASKKSNTRMSHFFWSNGVISIGEAADHVWGAPYA
jgi:hypothetical protein